MLRPCSIVKAHNLLKIHQDVVVGRDGAGNLAGKESRYVHAFAADSELTASSFLVQWKAAIIYI